MATFKAPSTIPSRKNRPDSSLQQSENTAIASESVDVETDKTIKQAVVSVAENRQIAVDDRENERNSATVVENNEGANEDTNEGVATDEIQSEKSSIALHQNLTPSTETKEYSSGTLPPTPSLPYTEPHWSGAPSSNYYLTVIKSGSVVDEIDISSKPFQVFGRLPVCDVALDHPSISRYHAILQYRPTDATTTTADDEGGERNPLPSSGTNEAGFYVYDLNSTHGSFLNKSKLRPRVYYRVRVGQMVRFGGSSRLFVLEVGSISDDTAQEMVEVEAEAEIREIQREKEARLTRQRNREEEMERLAREKEEMGATWGMVMDEIQHRENEDEEFTLDPEREAYYKDDPKKALKKYFDREGIEFDYDVEEEGSGRDKTYIARVTLPIEIGDGEMVVVEESVRGKKKDAIVQCALKACRILDSNDMLRVASKRRQRLTKNWEDNDYYDSDEDSFLDRTGELDHKRRQRMKRLGKLQEQAESYDSLVKRLEEVKQQKQNIENRLNKSKNKSQSGVGDSLDQYMSVVCSELDPSTITHLKKQVLELTKDEVRIKKLLKIVKPTEMPSVRTSELPDRLTDTNTATTNPKTTAINDECATVTGDHSTTITDITGDSSVPLSHSHYTTDSNITSSPSPSSSSSSTARRRRKKRPSSSSISEETNRGNCDDGITKKPRVLGPAMPPQSSRDILEQKKGVGSSEGDPEFASWLPPDNQSGDGRTHLNDKFGY